MGKIWLRPNEISSSDIDMIMHITGVKIFCSYCYSDAADYIDAICEVCQLYKIEMCVWEIPNVFLLSINCLDDVNYSYKIYCILLEPHCSNTFLVGLGTFHKQFSHCRSNLILWFNLCISFPSKVTMLPQKHNCCYICDDISYGEMWIKLTSNWNHV